MNDKSCVIKRNDYEQYSIKLPLNFLIGKKRNKYIFRELEKMHPCFSDDCCFDSKLLYKNWKFFANVLVMNKLTLANYKFENPKGKFRTEEKRFRTIFDDKKQVNVLSIFAGLFCLFVLGMILYVYGNDSKQKEVEIKNEKEDFEGIENLAERGDVIKRVFDVVEKTNGTITYLSWISGESNEDVILSVDGVFAEEIYLNDSEIKVSSVNYLNNIPNLRLKHSSKINKIDFETVNQTDFLQFVSKLRKLLMNNQCKILEENNFPFSIKFTFSADKFEKLFDDLEKLFSVELFFCSTLHLTKSDSFTVKMAIENNKKNNSSINVPRPFNVFQFIGENKKRFFTRNEIKNITPNKMIDKKELKINQLNNSENGKKVIGKIEKNGQISTFYYEKDDKKIYFEQKTK